MAQYLSGIGGHDPNSKDKDELGHVPSFLPAYSLCNSDLNSISVNSYFLSLPSVFRLNRFSLICLMKSLNII